MTQPESPTSTQARGAVAWNPDEHRSTRRIALELEIASDSPLSDEDVLQAAKSTIPRVLDRELAARRVAPSPVTLTPRATWDQIKDAAARGGLQVHVDGDEVSDRFTVVFRRATVFRPDGIDPAYLGPEAQKYEQAMSTTAVAPARSNLRDALQTALNRCSAEGGSNTPDFILAGLLLDVLGAFNHAVQERAKWYGRMDEPGQARPDPERIAHLEERVRDLLALCDKLRRDEALLDRIRDLLHERYLQLCIRDKDAPPTLVDVVRGLINDAHVPSVDARDMADLRSRAEKAELALKTALADYNEAVRECNEATARAEKAEGRIADFVAADKDDHILRG